MTNLEVLKLGDAYDSYLNAEPGRVTFTAPNAVAQFTYKKFGKDIETIGGICGPKDLRPAALSSFVDHYRAEKLALTAWNVPEADVEVYRSRGFRATKLGEELFLSLPDLTWQGKAFWKFRTKVNGVLRAGVSTRELDAGEFKLAKPKLRKITEDQLSQKPQRRELEFFVGTCPPDQLLERRVFVAERDSEIVAFVVCLPFKGGKAWGVDSFRFSSDAPRNTMLALIKAVADKLKEEDCIELSLGAAPGVNCATPIQDDNPGIRKMIVFFFNYLHFIYDLRGVFEFKRQFKPETRNVYVCCYPDQITINGIRAFLSTFGVLNIDWTRLFKNIWQKLTTKLFGEVRYGTKATN